jgi:glycine cleavage system transcriptional repressor
VTAYLILTAVGSDRPGLVDEVAEYLSDHRLNIETSRMAVLGGEFAMLVLVSGAEEEIARLASDPSPLTRRTGLETSIKRTSAPDARAVAAAVPYAISTSGMDHPGIVHDVARVLHRFEVSIESLDTRVGRAPISGTPVFSMEGTVAVPVEVRIRELREALEELSDRLNMDIEFAPVERA